MLNFENIQKNLNNEKNIKEDEKIGIFPFHGKSKYLLDRLYIIGYDSSTLNKLFSNKENLFYDNSDNTFPKYKVLKSSYYSKISQTTSKESLSSHDYIKEFRIKEPPSVLNEIINDYNKQVLDIDITLEMIFPNKPIFYSVKEPKREYSPSKRRTKNFRGSNYNAFKFEIIDHLDFEDINEIMENKKYSIVFSSNPQIDKINKKSINGFCYINYCQYKEKKFINEHNYTFYVPIGICFISEFPFYNSYYKLSEQIFNLFKSKKIEVPIEIMLYNLINNTLSPIKGDIDLCIEPVSFHNNANHSMISKGINGILNENEDEKKEKKKEITPLTFNDYNINKINISNLEGNLSNSSKILAHVENKKQNTIDNKKSLKKKIAFIDGDLENLLTSRKFGGEKKNLFEQIKFPFLQGYPLLHYNLSKILFDNFSISKMIFLFINTFLEKDILIFSENIELLSLAINSLQNLNYPLNDNIYYNINACVPFNKYIYGNSNFILTATTSLVGINSPFKLEYKINNKLKEHIIYDLDSHEIYLEEKKDSDFFQYIEKILKIKDEKEYKGSLLFNEIKSLFDSLNSIKENYKNLEDSFNNNNFYYNKNLNLGIQETFYRFIINITIYYYRQLISQIDLENINENNDIKIMVNFNENYENESDIKYKDTEYDKYFFSEFKNTFKFNLFFKNYLNYNECLELYHIPYLFFDEFLSILSRLNDQNSTNNYILNFFKIFENLYNKKQLSKINVDFNTFLSEYFKKYKNIFERDIIDLNLQGKTIVKYSESKKYLNYQWYELENILLLKYILFTKSINSNEYERMFNLNAILNENIPKEIKINDIEDEIEKEILKDDYYNNGLLIKDCDICCMNIIILISISLKYINLERYISIFIGNLFKDFFLFRKYYHMILDMIYKVIIFELYENKSNNGNYKKINNLLSFYYPCINSFREKNIIPNKKIINTILNMIKIDHYIRNEKINLNETNELEENNNEIKKIDNINYTIFIKHNFEYKNIVEERRLIHTINKSNLDRLKFLANAEKNINLIPKIVYITKYIDKENKINNLTVESEIFSQRKIKNILNEEYQKYLKNNLDRKALDINNIINCILNIYIYIRNSNKFSEIIDISESLKFIFDDYIKDLIQ